MVAGEFGLTGGARLVFLIELVDVVIDEADLVLSFGYDEDVKRITAALPRIYQGLLLSATLSPELDDLKRVVLHR